jgi:hypothetical protein
MARKKEPAEKVKKEKVVATAVQTDLSVLDPATQPEVEPVVQIDSTVNDQPKPKMLSFFLKGMDVGEREEYEYSATMSIEGFRSERLKATRAYAAKYSTLPERVELVSY